MQEADNVLRILKETRAALEKNDTFNLRGLSNQTINTASLAQDPDNIAVAVMVYSFRKSHSNQLPRLLRIIHDGY